MKLVHTVAVMAALASAMPVFSQANPELAQQLQRQFKDDEAYIQTSVSEYTFSKNTSQKDITVSVLEKKKESYLSLRYTSSIMLAEFYDNTSSVTVFAGKSSNGDRKSTTTQVRGDYTDEGIFYSDDKFCSQRLELKEVGQTWDMEVFKRYNDSKYFTIVFFNDRFPIGEKQFRFVIPDYIDIELKEFNFEGFDIVKTEKKVSGSREITYTAKNLKAFERDRYRPGLQHGYPHLVVLTKSIQHAGKTVNVFSNTDDLYAWNHSLTIGLQSDAAVLQPVISKIIGDKKTDEEKIKAVYYWVQDNIRYIAFEDGLAGYRPDEADKVCENRYGDCKGMANLTKQLLKLAGYDARLVWIGTHHLAHDFSLPSLCINNHMICAVNLKDTTYFLDGTEKYCAFRDYAERIQGRPVMIENGDAYELKTIPSFDYTHNTEQHRLSMNLNNELLVGKGQSMFRGETKKDLLYEYYHIESSNKEKVLLAAANDGGNFSVKNIKASDLTERSGPLNMDFDCSYKNSVSTFNNEYYIDMDYSKDYRNFKIEEDRYNNVDFHEKIHRIYTVELTVPEGYQVSHLPEGLTVKEKDFAFELNYKQEGNKIVYTKTISIYTGILQRASFQKWNEALKKMNKVYEDQLILKKL